MLQIKYIVTHLKTIIYLHARARMWLTDSGEFEIYRIRCKSTFAGIMNHREKSYDQKAWFFFINTLFLTSQISIAIFLSSRIARSMESSAALIPRKKMMMALGRL